MRILQNSLSGIPVIVALEPEWEILVFMRSFRPPAPKSSGRYLYLLFGDFGPKSQNRYGLEALTP